MRRRRSLGFVGAAMIKKCFGKCPKHFFIVFFTAV